MPAKKSARSQPAAAAQPVQTTKQLQQQLAQAKEREAKLQESEAKLRQELDEKQKALDNERECKERENKNTEPPRSNFLDSSSLAAVLKQSNDNTLAALRTQQEHSNESKSWLSPFEAGSRLSLHDWLTLYERATLALSDTQRINAIQRHIKDPSVLSRLLSATFADMASWPSLKKLLLGAQDPAGAEDRFEAVKQGDSEATEEYWVRFQSALRECHAISTLFTADEARKVRIFKRGLKSATRAALALQNYNTVAELKELACKWEREQVGASARTPLPFNNLELEQSATPREPAVDPRLEGFTALHPEAKDSILEEAQQLKVDPLQLFALMDRSNGRCHECGRTGHWKNDCPERRHADAATPGQKRKRHLECPRHPRAAHSADSCFNKCPQHPFATHSARDCPTDNRPLVTIGRSGTATSRTPATTASNRSRGQRSGGGRDRVSIDADLHQGTRRLDSGPGHSNSEGSNRSGRVHPERQNRF
jgi:hypothetical protein